jgi:hypothetical protein
MSLTTHRISTLALALAVVMGGVCVVLESSARATSIQRPLHAGCTLLDLALKAQERAASIQTLEVEYVVTKSGTAPYEFIPRSEERIVQEPGRIRFEHKAFRIDHENPGQILPGVLTVRVWDGTISTSMIHNGMPGLANIDAGRHQGTESQMSEFFNLNLIGDDKEGVRVINTRSLASILQSPWTTLRPATEIVGDRECCVVDWTDPDSGQVDFTAWLDAERGGVPMKYRLRRQTYQASEVVEVVPNTWMAVEGTKELRFSEEQSLTMNIAVATDESGTGGERKLVVNGAMDQSDFVEAIPKGYKVVDNGTTFYIQE